MVIASSSGTETTHNVQPTRRALGLFRHSRFRLVRFDQRRIVGGMMEGAATTAAATTTAATTATATEDGGY